MQVSTYVIIAGVADALVGGVVGLAAVRGGKLNVSALIAASLCVFVLLSGFVIVYEVIYGNGLAAGLAWAFIYSISNTALSAGAAAACAVAPWLRIRANRA